MFGPSKVPGTGIIFEDYNELDNNIIIYKSFRSGEYNKKGHMQETKPTGKHADISATVAASNQQEVKLPRYPRVVTLPKQVVRLLIIIITAIIIT